jgi:hypothetical protein
MYTPSRDKVKGIVLHEEVIIDGNLLERFGFAVSNRDLSGVIWTNYEAPGLLEGFPAGTKILVIIEEIEGPPERGSV